MSSPDYWFRIITELEQHLSLRELGTRVETSAPTLCRIKAGEVEPRYSVGSRLIALHRLRYCICSANETRPVVSSDSQPPG